MKNYFSKLTGTMLALVLCQMLAAQNPIWTLPGYQFETASEGYTPLPQSPIDPITGMPETDALEAYQGATGDHTHAAYTDPNGEILFFAVDDQVYDSGGWTVGFLERSSRKRGFSERLILPMGNDCRRYAIIYPASAESSESYSSTSDRMRLYMAVYDMDGTDGYSDYAVGDLEGQVSGAGNTLTDISQRDGTAYASSSQVLYGYSGFSTQGNYRANYQIAATELIDNCFYYVFVFDGRSIMRYKLTTSDLEWDNYVLEIPESNFNSEEMRTEMELVKLSNGNYRIAIPTCGSDGTGISIYNISSSNYELTTSSRKYIDLGEDASAQNAEPIGLEFDSSGRYLYFTHKNNLTPQWASTVLEVYDYNTANILTSSLPSLTNVSNYQNSFIERFGNTLYLATDNALATLQNSQIPTSPSVVWTDAAIAISSGYQSNAGENAIFYGRYILPEQLDMAYPDLATMSCDCCARWSPGVDRYVATTSDTWTPTSNPFGNVTDVYIKDELIIDPGVNLRINGMNFYFGEEARVIVRREVPGTSTTGAFLLLGNGTVFTADHRCGDESFSSCGISEECEKTVWEGIKVEGISNNTTQSWSASTPHARLLVRDNSKIEYAITAIQAGNSDLPDRRGGMVRVTGSEIKDCVEGVRFDPYTRLSGSTEMFTQSFIDFTTFRTTTDWFYGLPKHFVIATDFSGVFLRGNTYINEDPLSFSLGNRGNGVVTKNSRIESSWKCAVSTSPCPSSSLDQNTYLNLDYGVYGLDNGLSTRTHYEYHSEFQNCYIGIYLNSFMNPEILDSEFGVMAYPESTGIYLDNSTGYIVENNELYTYNGFPNNRNIGIYVHESGKAENEIYRNVMYNLNIGGYTEGVNADGNNAYEPGLDWLCNQFRWPINSADIYLDGSMSKSQGECGVPPVDLPAGNLFSWSGSGHFDLYMTSGSIPLVDYNYHTLGAPTPANVEPLTISNNNFPPSQDWTLSQCLTIKYDDNACLVKKTSLPFDGPKSNGLAKDGALEYDYQSVYDHAQQFTELIGELSAQLDGGLTVEILNLIEALDNEPGSAINEEILLQIQTLVEGIEGPVSSSLLNGLSSSGFEILEQLANSAYEELGMNEDLEFSLKSQRKERDYYWQDVASFFMKDTLEILQKEELITLLQEFEPKSIGRFASILCPPENQSWIEDDENVHYLNMMEYAFPELEGNSLPRDIPEFYEGNFFSYDGNVSALNLYYIENDAIYNPVIREPEIEGLVEVAPKSASSASEKKESVVNVQPNPFNDQVTFDLTNLILEDGTVIIRVYDLLGRTVFETLVLENQNQVIIDGHKLSTGYLTYGIFMNESLLESGKLIHLKN